MIWYGCKNRGEEQKCLKMNVLEIFIEIFFESYDKKI